MRVPSTYYFRFYFMNTILGLSFCLFLSFFPSMELTVRFFPYSVYFLFIVFLIHQTYIIKSFFNPFRGNFEYSYLGRKIAKTVNSKIAQNYGFIKLFGLWFDEFGYIGMVRGEIYKKILANESLMADKEFEFSFYMRLARIRAKQDDIEIEKEYLNKALQMKPNHPITLFRLAHSYEKEGNTTEAIKHYKSLLEIKLTDSSDFKTFVTNQIERINKSGPSRRPPNFGLKFAVMY